jgi:hypothetical protein
MRGCALWMGVLETGPGEVEEKPRKVRCKARVGTHPGKWWATGDT